MPQAEAEREKIVSQIRRHLNRRGTVFSQAPDAVLIERLALNMNRSGLGSDEAQQAAQDRGFATPGRPGQQDLLAGPDGH